MAKAIEVKLNKSGFSARAVYNGEPCMAELRTGKYDLVILDLMMPIMDGWTVLEKILAESIPIKIIVSSNLSQSEDVKKAKALGARAFLIKSDVTLADIVAEVTRVLAM